MKPIETYYKGYHFRSRLEARWAVFFEKANITWEYEKEGFDFENGIRYLPDFWLPEIKFENIAGLWVEIKPRDGIDALALKKAHFLADTTNYAVIIVRGDPYENLNEQNYELIRSRLSIEMLRIALGIMYIVPPKCNFASLFLFGGASLRSMIVAANESRAARFEYGEMP